MNNKRWLRELLALAGEKSGEKEVFE
jgi:hypothetical protein